MQIIVGSINPVKLNATRGILSQVHPQAVFNGIRVESGVSDQPWGNEETRLGAKNRALAVLEQTKADLGIGLEGGVQKSEFGLMTCAWCVIVDRKGTIGVGGNSSVMLPTIVQDKLLEGHELGTAMDMLSGDKNTKHKGGAIGILTNNLYTRQTAYEVIISMALAPFLNPQWFKIHSD